MKELVALAKASPGKINFGSSGPGATSHLAGEYLKMLTGIDIVHVPFKGASPALIAVMSSQIEMLISGLSTGMPFVRDQKLVLLGSEQCEAGTETASRRAVDGRVDSGLRCRFWYAVLAPAATPRADDRQAEQGC